MKANSCFSFSRLSLVLKRDLMENLNMYLFGFLAPYVVFLFVMFLGYLNVQSFELFEELILSTFISMLFFGGFVYASYIMQPMNTLQKRVSFLMLPATNLEKFVCRTLLVSVGFFLLVILALMLAEATRFLFLPLFDLPDTFHQSALPFIGSEVTQVDVMRFTGPGSQESLLINQLIRNLGWMLLGWLYSFFILGGCYWYKHPFWKTLGVMFVFNNIFGFLIFFCVGYWMKEVDWEAFWAWCETYFSWVSITGVLFFFIVLVGLLLLFNWWLSYRCFTRSQVIKPKFRLL